MLSLLSLKRLLHHTILLYCLKRLLYHTLVLYCFARARNMILIVVIVINVALLMAQVDCGAYTHHLLSCMSIALNIGYTYYILLKRGNYFILSYFHSFVFFFLLGKSNIPSNTSFCTNSDFGA